MKIPPRSHRSPSSKPTMSVHFKEKVSIVFVSGKRRINKKRLDKGRCTVEDFELFGYYLCKNLCWELKRFHMMVLPATSVLQACRRETLYNNFIID